MGAALPPFVVCPACRGGLDAAPRGLVCRACGRSYERADGIPRLLDPTAPGIEAKLRELAGWPELAREQGWYEADDRIDAALPFLNRDLGWEDRAWAATEHGFQLLLDRYVKPGDRVLEIGAAKSWASLHLAAARLRVRRLRPRRRPADRPRPRAVLRGARRPVPAGPGRRRAAAVRRRRASTSPSASRRSTTRSTSAPWSASSRASTRRGGIVAGLNEGTRAPVPERREPRAGAREGARHQRARAHDVGLPLGVRARRACGRCGSSTRRARTSSRSGTSRASCCALGRAAGDAVGAERVRLLGPQPLRAGAQGRLLLARQPGTAGSSRVHRHAEVRRHVGRRARGDQARRAPDRRDRRGRQPRLRRRLGDGRTRPTS